MLIKYVMLMWDGGTDMKIKYMIMCLLLLVSLMSMVLADSDDAFDMDDPEVFGIELEKLFYFNGGILATILCVLTFLAYKRSGHSRLVVVCFAFGLFAVKTFLISSELFIDEISWVDPVSAFLDFGILLAFFWGVIKK